MLRFENINVTEKALGKPHGLNLQTLFAEYADRTGLMIQALWDTPTAPNAWREWLTLGENTQLRDQIKVYCSQIQNQFDQLVIIGIGGSALGPLAMFEALLPSYWNERTTAQRGGHPRYYFVDNVDPDKLQGLLSVLDLKRTLVNVITKSGTTAETMAGFMWLKTELEKEVGPDQVKNHLVVTTDPQKGLLRHIAQTENLTAFDVPANVGGRFSVFSAVGLLPAGILGLSVSELLAGIQALTPTLQSTRIDENPAAQSALIQYLMYRQGKPISVLMPYSAKLASVADWYVQLWAESLGKKRDLENRVVHEGPTPLKAVGVTDQHAQVQLFNEGPYDKLFTFIRLEQFENTLKIPNLYAENEDLNYLGDKTFERLLQAEGDATRASLLKNQRPNVSIILPRLDAHHFAQLLFFLEVQTAFMGHLLHVNPFDQPGVELAKQYTYALMGRPGFEHLKSELN